MHLADQRDRHPGNLLRNLPPGGSGEEQLIFFAAVQGERQIGLVTNTRQRLGVNDRAGSTLVECGPGRWTGRR